MLYFERDIKAEKRTADKNKGCLNKAFTIVNINVSILFTNYNKCTILM